MSNDKAVEFFVETMKTQGISVSTVRDGHVLLVKLAFLKELIEKYSDKEAISIFLKRPTYDN